MRQAVVASRANLVVSTDDDRSDMNIAVLGPAGKQASQADEPVVAYFLSEHVQPANT